MSTGRSIPYDITVNILLRFRVKSLCRFKCVPKSWLALITDPWFVKLHLDRTKRNRLILSSDYSIHSVDLETTPPAAAVGIDFPLKNTGHSVKVLGCCNGLVCFSPQPHIFFVFNPSTRDYKRLPDFHIPIIFRPKEFYGFIYVQSIDDYKFVKPSFNSCVSVFSLKMNTWKRVRNFPYQNPTPSCAIGRPLNGALHWATHTHGGERVIAAFDLMEESFKHVPLPAGLSLSIDIGVLGDCLCLLELHAFSDLREFWVMKEYGVKESWTRVFIKDQYFLMEPLCFWKNSKMLLVMNNNRLVICNQNNGVCEEFMVDDIPAKFLSYMDVESLVSPHYKGITN